MRILIKDMFNIALEYIIWKVPVDLNSTLLNVPQWSVPMIYMFWHDQERDSERDPGETRQNSEDKYPDTKQKKHANQKNVTLNYYNSE